MQSKNNSSAKPKVRAIKSGGNSEIPLGLSSALASNPQALRRFAGMTEQQRRQIVEQTSAVTSRAEMRQLVERINTENF